jgi:hypothetical protein|tara:strand:- start:4155 stop:4508 length:354 start_codon:yes stop_codon:yes gene_type:complete
MTKFKCASFDNLIFVVDDIEFKYSECKVMSEKEHPKYAHVELILKSPCGNYAEVLVTSDGDKPGKSNIVSGEYDGMLIDQSVATALTKLNHAFHEEELNRKEKRELDSKLKKQAQLT